MNYCKWRREKYSNSSWSQISIYKVIFDRLSQSKDFSENDLEALTKIEKILNKKNYHLKFLLFKINIINFYSDFFLKYQIPSSGLTRTHFFILQRGPTYRDFCVVEKINLLDKIKIY